MRPASAPQALLGTSRRSLLATLPALAAAVPLVTPSGSAAAASAAPLTANSARPRPIERFLQRGPCAFASEPLQLPPLPPGVPPGTAVTAVLRRPDRAAAGGGTLPLVLLSPGFLVASSQYAGCLDHLASWGWVAALGCGVLPSSKLLLRCIPCSNPDLTPTLLSTPCTGFQLLATTCSQPTPSCQTLLQLPYSQPSRRPRRRSLAAAAAPAQAAAAAAAAASGGCT